MSKKTIIDTLVFYRDMFKVCDVFIKYIALMAFMGSLIGFLSAHGSVNDLKYVIFGTVFITIVSVSLFITINKALDYIIGLMDE